MRPQSLRRIELEYAQELTAHNSELIKRSLRELTSLQAAAAEANIRAMGEIASRQDQSNTHLAGIEDSLCALNDEVTLIRSGIDDVNLNLHEIEGSVRAGFQVVEDLLDRIVQRLTEHSQQLAEIGEILRRPYETQARELREQAQKWLQAGLNTTGDDRRDNWSDALSLFETILQNPVGKQDYVVWFQIGYLRWQHLKDVASAEAALNTARRLSAPQPDLYHLKSLRHLAYMQYLQGNFEKAYDSIGPAVAFSRDHETLYDSARYAAKTNRRAEALQRLDECINLEPPTIDLMFAEEDFASLR